MEIQQRIIGFKKIKYAKSNGGLVTMTNYGVLEDGAINNESTNKLDREPSDSFEIQLRTLLGHALLFSSLDGKKIGEKEMKNRKVVDMPEFKNVNIVSYKISGDPGEDNETLSIVLEIAARGGKITVNVPPISIHDQDYEYYEFLQHDLEHVIRETRLYNDQIIKIQKESQLNLFDQEPEVKSVKTKASKSKDKESQFDSL